MLVDNVSDHQAQFSKWWVQEWKAVPFPERVSRSAGVSALPPVLSFLFRLRANPA